MRLYLIRHGETELNRTRIVQGYEEVPINDMGIRQASALGRRMAEVPLDHIYASDLRRTTMTAGILAAYTGKPMTYHEGFRERHPGEMTGKDYETAEAFFTDPTYDPPGGESVPVFIERVANAFDWLVQEEGDKGRDIAVVSHGMVCGAFLNLCIGMDIEEIKGSAWPNTCVTIADYDNGWNLVTRADASHLDDDEVFVDYGTGA